MLIDQEEIDAQIIDIPGLPLGLENWKVRGSQGFYFKLWGILNKMPGKILINNTR